MFSEKENIERIAVNIYSLAISIIPSPATNTQTEGRIFRGGTFKAFLRYFPNIFLTFLAILWRLAKGLHFCPLTIFFLPLNIEDWECGNTPPKPPLTDHFSERPLPWPGWLRAF